MKAVGIVLGVIVLGVTWVACVAASLAVPACAVWALGHFAFGWW